MISTVDAFQGGEREIIILSCVRTKHAGFIDSDRCVCHHDPLCVYATMSSLL